MLGDGLDPRLVVARRDVASLSREKTIVLALLIQLFVAAFSSFLVVGLTSLYDPGSVQSGEVDIAVAGDASDELVAAARQQQAVDVEVYPSAEAANNRFARGRADAVLLANYVELPGETGRRIQIAATVPDGSIRTTLIVVQVRELLQTVERSEREERLAEDPLDLPQEPEDASPYFGFTYKVLIPLLVFLPAFISGSVAVDSVTEEIERGTMELLRVAPLSLVDIVDGKALGMVAIAPAQAALWLFLLILNGTAIANFLAILAYVTAVATVVVVFGVVLGVRTGRRRPAQLLYSVITLVVFGVAVVLPEHPATTVAKLAIDSPTLTTYGSVVGSLALAAGLYALTRRYVAGLPAESL